MASKTAWPAPGLGTFERYLTLWVVLCIGAGILIGKIAPEAARFLDSLTIHVGGAPVVSIPIAVALFFMMYPIMVKIDFGEVVRAGKNTRPVLLTLLVNWGIKPFTMLGIATLFLGILFRGFLPGVEIVKDGTQVELFRSYISGAILLGIAPCTAMVLVWGFLARGNPGHTLVMVAINSLTMLILYGPLGKLLLGINRMPVPWQALLLSISIYVALPLVAGYVTRRGVVGRMGEGWFRKRFVPWLTPVSVIALLLTLILLFTFKGETIVRNPLTILWIAVPLFLQTWLVFGITYGLGRLLRFRYEDAAPSAMIGASNHFEVAIATATTLYGLSSGAALATVVGVLIEVPVMLMLVRVCLRTKHWFAPGARRLQEVT